MISIGMLLRCCDRAQGMTCQKFGGSAMAIWGHATVHDSPYFPLSCDTSREFHSPGHGRLARLPGSCCAAGFGWRPGAAGAALEGCRKAASTVDLPRSNAQLVIVLHGGGPVL